MQLTPFAKRTSATLLMALLCAGCAWLQPSVGTGAVLFQDEFTHPISGWDRYQDQTYTADYGDGVYQIAVFRPHTEVWTRPDLEFTDVHVYVAASKAEGPDDNLFGIICRYRDPQNFYFGVVSNDGYGGVGMYRDGVAHLFGEDRLLPSPAILHGSGTNHLEVKCVGNRLTLSVNGILIAEAQIAGASPGDVGLMVGTYDEPGVVIQFDNFSVVKP